ncbi:MAG: penicillin-binding protein 2 [Pseudomonadota bacterium]
MIRRPLRPLAGVIRARSRGENPDLVEAHRRAERLQAARAQERRRAEWRLTLLAFLLLAAFGAATLRMAVIAASDPGEPVVVQRDAPVSAARADITDRHGRVLATNIVAHALYSEPSWMVDPVAATDGLMRIFPDLDRAWLTEKFARRKFFFIRQAISPEQMQKVHDLGEPGLKFAPREIRAYPAGRPVAHLVGHAGIRNPDVDAAELRGIAGVELTFDAWLSDPRRFTAPAPQALALSIDLTAQIALRDVLAAAIDRTGAKGAAGVVMDARTGEVLAMVSLPDFDPNDRPEDPKDRRLFNRAAQGVYELGSTFKLITAAMVMERRLVGPDTLIDATSFRWAGLHVTDSHRMPPELPLREVIARSSNPATARLAVLAGAGAQKDLLERLGLFEPLSIELPAARQARPLLPPRWSEPYLMTISYGHGLAVTPLHLAAAYASLTNGGLRVQPTLLRDAPPPGEEARVISQATSAALRDMLRLAVTMGTGKQADVPGYRVAGKTGTAEKVAPEGGYDEDRVLATFAAVLPADAPQLVVVVTLDEGSIEKYGQTWRSAGWTAAPLAGETIRRVAPILGLRPGPGVDPVRRPAPGTDAIPVRN